MVAGLILYYKIPKAAPMRLSVRVDVLLDVFFFCLNFF